MTHLEDVGLALHTAARRHLLDRFQQLVQAYAKVPNHGRAADDYHYREDAKAIYPRYNVVDAIRVEVERLDPDSLPDVETLVERLLHAGYYGESFMTTGKTGEVEARAMNDERQRFVEWVEQSAQHVPTSVEPLPYRRTLSEDEVRRWWAAVEASWPIEGGGWWAPINECASGNPLALDASAFWDADDADGPATLAVRRAVGELGVRRVIELREYGPSFEVDLDAFFPTYNGAEGTFTSEGLGWLIFASHEGATVIGGTVVDSMKRLWPAWETAVWKGWE
jgi:hypothetical protein